jgi:hypothetical protein
VTGKSWHLFQPCMKYHCALATTPIYSSTSQLVVLAAAHLRRLCCVSVLITTLQPQPQSQNTQLAAVAAHLQLRVA